MLKTVKKLIVDLHDDRQRLSSEVSVLKKKLQHRHTEINDLRYKTRELEKRLKALEQNQAPNVVPLKNKAA
jgi:predicted nuclease with TOPRIM domain